MNYIFKWGLGIGDWGLGIGDWGLGIDEVKNVCAICPSEDMRLIYAINKSGSCIKVIKD
jgi:hypothetical protein